MRLSKQENLRLLRSCTHVKIIEFTEKLANLKQRQIKMLDSNPDLKTFITGVYINEKQENNEPYDLEPSSETLATTYLSSLSEFNESLNVTPQSNYFDNNSRDVEEKFNSNLRTFSYRNTLTNKFNAALEEYRAFADKLYSSPKKPINLQEVKDFLDTKNKNHTESFTKFAKGVKAHSPMHLGFAYRKLANNIASRNKIIDKDFETKAGKAFNFKRADLSLKRDFEGRFKNHGIRLAALAALTTIIIGAHAIFGTHKPNEPIQETTTPIISVVPETTSNPSIPPIIEVSAEADEQEPIFRNTIKNPSTYEEACQDYFEKIADIYKYNTGINIDFSGYGQSNIGYNSAARIFVVEYNGQEYLFSGQGGSAPNTKYLLECFKAIGAKYEEKSSEMISIVDQNDTNRSLVIADSKGNPLRSGKVLTGSNNAYNSVYVSAGKKIAEQQGISNPSEAQCVALYLLSDAHAGDPELANATKYVLPLARYIKGTFYYRDGKSDPYTCQLYAQKSQECAAAFEAQIANQENEQEKGDQQEQR